MTRSGVRVALLLTLVMLVSTVAFPVAAQNIDSLGVTDGEKKQMGGTVAAQQSPTPATPTESPPYFDMTGGTVAPGDNITIWVSFYNDGTATEKMDVQLSFAEPIDFDGWDIVSFGAPGKGSWFESDRYFSADSVSADSVVEAKFTIQVPANATAGTYTIETSFTSYTKDGSRTESAPTATVEVTGSGNQNQAPTAKFNHSPSNPTTGTNVAFDASDSSDSDGSISSYEWDFDNDGTTDATGRTATHVFQSAGDYDVSLTVTDDAGSSNVQTRTVQVQAADSGSGSDDGQDSTATGQWPTFQRDTARTGYAANGSGPTSDISEQWRTSLNGITFSSPTVRNGTVYIGDDGLTVRAINAATNTTEWTASVDDTVRSAPAVTDGTVYVTTRAGSLYALDASDGSEQWTFTPSGGISHLPAVLSSPVVTGGTVYYGTPAGTLYAIDATSGTEEWSFQTDGEIHASPAVVDGTVYIGSADGGATMYALDASTGTKQWEKDTGTRSAPGFGPADIDSSPTVDSGTVYFANYRGIMWAVNANDGSTKWTTDMGASIVSSSPAIADDRVIIGTGSGSGTGHIRALDANDGTVLWTVQPGDFVISSPAIVGSTAYIGSDDGKIYALDIADGSEVWSYNASRDNSKDYDITSSPAVVDGSVYVGVIEGFTAGSLLALSGSSSGGSNNQAPTSSFTTSSTTPTTGEQVTFDASSSSDTDGSIASYEWDLNNDGQTDATGESVTHTFSNSGDQTVTLTVTDNNGLTATSSKTITVQSMFGGTGVQFSPTTITAGTGSSTTVDLQAVNIDNGVKSYSYTATISNNSVATITNVELVGASQGGLGVNVTITADGSKAIVSVAQGDDSNGVFSTLTLSTQNPGTTDLGITQVTLGDDDFSSYDITGTTNATVEVSETTAPPAIVGNNQPTDPDGDGKFDDLTGDGRVNILDVGALLQNRNSPAVQNNPTKFDFTGDGRVNILDVGKLLQQVL